MGCTRLWTYAESDIRIKFSARGDNLVGFLLVYGPMTHSFIQYEKNFNKFVLLLSDGKDFSDLLIQLKSHSVCLQAHVLF